jgi:adenylosuccinate lyase
MDHQIYQNPLIARYASRQMSELFGDQKKFSTWRRLWVYLAEAQRELGLPITEEQIRELRGAVDDIDFDGAARYEKELRHDVMAHVHTFGDRCPNARPIVHWGATSCFVTDNADLMIFREAMNLVASRLAAVIGQLGAFAARYRDMPCLGFTHLQPAQPVTVGKRATLWAYDLVLDLEELEHRISRLKARGVKGTTGTQASFLELFSGDHRRVEQLDVRVAEKAGFASTCEVTGQTYTRKVDSQIMDVLSGIAQSAHKMATDLRILAHRKEIEEPFEKSQIGSSAMPYKRNPMRSERICALARFVISLQSSPANTLATQWMERTLDDSANRRLVMPQAFLTIDAILILLLNVTSGLVVNERVIARNLDEELPFMATENILMAAVNAGGDRQLLHEKIRRHSIEAGRAIKELGLRNDLLDRLAADPDFAAVNVGNLVNAGQFVGRAPQQVDNFCNEVVAPIVERYSRSQAESVDLHV